MGSLPRTHLFFGSQHCAGQTHKAAVENDPSFARLAELIGWNGFENRARDDESEGHVVPQDKLPKTRDNDEANENEGNSREELCRTAGTPGGVQDGETCANRGAALAKGGGKTSACLPHELDPSVPPREPLAPVVVNMDGGSKVGVAGGHSDDVDPPPVRVIEDWEPGEGSKGGGTYKHPSPAISQESRGFDVDGPVVTPSVPQPMPGQQEEKVSRDPSRDESRRTPYTPRQAPDLKSTALPIVTPSSNGRCPPGESSACGTEPGRGEARPIVPVPVERALHTALCGGDAEAGKSLFFLVDGSPPTPACVGAEGGDAVPLRADPCQDQQQKASHGALVNPPGGADQEASAGSLAKIRSPDACMPHPPASSTTPAGSPGPAGDGTDGGLTASHGGVGDPGGACPRAGDSAPAEEQAGSATRCDNDAPRRRGSLRKRSRRELNMLADSPGFAGASASSAPSSRRRRGQRADSGSSERHAARAREEGGSKRKSKLRSRPSSARHDGEPGNSRPGSCRRTSESQTGATAAGSEGGSASRPEEEAAGSSCSTAARGYACDGGNSSSDASQEIVGRWPGYPCSVPWTSPSAGPGVVPTREAEKGAGISERLEKIAVGTGPQRGDSDDEAAEVARNLLVAWRGPLEGQAGGGDGAAYSGDTRPKMQQSLGDVRDWSSTTAPAGVGAIELVVSSGAVLAGECA